MIKEIFLLNQKPKSGFLIMTFVCSIVAIVLGSTLYINKNTTQSSEYSNSVRIVAKIVDNQNQVVSDEITKEATNALGNRLTGGSNINGATINVLGKGSFEALQANINTDSAKQHFEDLITKKATLIVTNAAGKPLFLDGKFDNNITIDYSKPNEIDWARYQVPIAENGATSALANDGTTNIVVNFKDSASQIQWAQLSFNLLQDQTSKVLVYWYNLEEFVNIANNSENVNDFIASGMNPYNFAFVNNEAKRTIGEGATQQVFDNSLKTVAINSSDYLIHHKVVSNLENGASFVIDGKYSSSTAQQWTFNINATSTSYKIEKLSSVFVNATQGNNAWRNTMIVGAVALGIISAFMLFNYGVLGLISSIALALYTFLTILIFTSLGGQWSPAVVGGLILGAGLAIDSSVVSFERLKRRLWYGDTLNKASKTANSSTLKTIFDSSITTLIIASVLFYFGIKTIKIFSLSLIISIALTMIIMVLFTRFLTSVILGLDFFKDRLYLLGVSKKYIETKADSKWYHKINYLNQSKWWVIAMLILTIIGVIVFSTLAGINQNIASGFNQSIEFNGGSYIIIKRDSSKDVFLSIDNAKLIVENIKNLNIVNNDDMKIYSNDVLQLNHEIIIYTKQIFSEEQLRLLSSTVQGNQNISDILFNTIVITTEQAKSLIINITITIAIIVSIITIYLLFRFGWSFSFATLLSILVEFILLTSLIAITRVTINSFVFIGFVAMILYSANDKIQLAGRIKNIISTKYYHVKLEKMNIKKIANQAINNNVKRSLITSLIIISTLLVAISFTNVLPLSLSISFLLGIIVANISTIFINLNIWTIFETIRQKKIRKREINNFWASGKVEEQTFAGFNNFNV